MTPLELEVLLHIYYSPEINPLMESMAGSAALRRFAEENTIFLDPEGTYRLTEKGDTFVKMLLATPIPIQQWIDPRTIQEFQP